MSQQKQCCCMLQGWAAQKSLAPAQHTCLFKCQQPWSPAYNYHQMGTGQRHPCKSVKLFHVPKRCTPPPLPMQTTPEPANIPVQTASGLHVKGCSNPARPTPCRRKLEEWSDGDSRELHLEVSPGEERTLEALVRFCYTKQIPFNRGGLLHREACGGCCTGRWAAQGGCCMGTLLHREVGCTGRWAAQGGCCTHRRAAQGATGGAAGARPVLDPILGSWLAACSPPPLGRHCADLGWALAAQIEQHSGAGQAQEA